MRRMRSGRTGQPLKVLVAIEGVAGGTLRHLQYLLQYTDRRDFNLHLAVSAVRWPGSREFFAQWASQGWHVHEIPMCREIAPQTDCSAFRRILSLCRSERFDVVHTHCAKAGFLGRLAARITGAGTVHTPHVLPFSHPPLGDLRRSLYLQLEKLAAGWTDRMVVLSRHQLALLIQFRLLPVERAVIIPNGIIPGEPEQCGKNPAREELGISQQAAVCLFVGRICEQKGLEILLDATEMMRDRVPGLCVLVVGNGPREGWLRSELARRRLSQIVRACGMQSPLGSYYAACDVVVMPSLVEGMPYVLLEAEAAGRPVVVSLVSGMEELIEQGGGGFLFPAGQAEALAGRLGALFSQPEMLEESGLRARQKARERWTAERCVQRVHEVYREVAGAR